MTTQNFISGDCVTPGVVFDDSYDTSRIEGLEFFLGSTSIGAFASMVRIGEAYCIQLTSAQTALLTGTYDFIIALTDSVMGVKHYRADTTLTFCKTGSSIATADTDGGVSFLVELNPLTSVTPAQATLIEYFEGHSPYIGENGNWWEWDSETQEYVDSGTQAGVISPDYFTITNSSLSADHKITFEHNHNTRKIKITVRDNSGVERQINNYLSSLDLDNAIVLDFGRNITGTWNVLLEWWA